MKTKAKVLVVEDHKIAQKIAVFFLNALGCQADIASSGSEALELFHKNHYDLIFMDIGLPDTDGFTVTKSIRSKEDKSNPVPVVALTAHANDLTRLQAIEVGMNDFLVKPLTKESCEMTLKKFVYEAEEVA